MVTFDKNNIPTLKSIDEIDIYTLMEYQSMLINAAYELLKNESCDYRLEACSLIELSNLIKPDPTQIKEIAETMSEKGLLHDADKLRHHNA